MKNGLNCKMYTQNIQTRLTEYNMYEYYKKKAYQQESFSLGCTKKQSIL